MSHWSGKGLLPSSMYIPSCSAFGARPLNSIGFPSTPGTTSTSFSSGAIRGAAAWPVPASERNHKHHRRAQFWLWALRGNLKLSHFCCFALSSKKTEDKKHYWSPTPRRMIQTDWVQFKILWVISSDNTRTIPTSICLLTYKGDRYLAWLEKKMKRKPLGWDLP